MNEIADLILFLFFLVAASSAVAWRSKENDLQKKQVEESTGKISVIVAFRNELEHLENLLYDLANQSIIDDLEIFLINDHSEDGGELLVQRYISDKRNFSLLHLKEETGKKAALRLGVDTCNNNLILQTDADCRIPKTWAQEMRRHCKGKDLVLGPIGPTKNEGSWGLINEIEVCILQLLTSAGIFFKRPIMANGANMLFTRTAFQAYDASGLGQEHASGDDQFLLDYISERTPERIDYLVSEKALITTNYPTEWKHMVDQRVRWAKKNNKSSWYIQVVGLVLLFSQVLAPFLLLAAVLQATSWYYVIEFHISKLFVECIFVYSYTNTFKLNYWKQTIIGTFIYPFFILSIINGMSKKDINWKGRKI